MAGVPQEAATLVVLWPNTQYCSDLREARNALCAHDWHIATSSSEINLSTHSANGTINNRYEMDFPREWPQLSIATAKRSPIEKQLPLAPVDVSHGKITGGDVIPGLVSLGRPTKLDEMQALYRDTISLE